MTQYNSLNVKLANSQLNQLKSATSNKFPHKLFLTDWQVSKFPNLFALTYQLISNCQKLNYLK